MHKKNVLATIATFAMVAGLMGAGSVGAIAATKDQGPTIQIGDAQVGVDYALAISEKIAKAKDTEKAIDALSDQDRAIFYAAITPADTQQEVIITADDVTAQQNGVHPSGAFSAMATGCWIATNTLITTNPFGGHLYNVTLQARWCASGGTVTTASRWNSWGEVTWIGWSHSGMVNTQSGVVSNMARTYVQHKFVWAPTGGTVLEGNPCVRHTGTQAGTSSSWTRTCGIY